MVGPGTVPIRWSVLQDQLWASHELSRFSRLLSQSSAAALRQLTMANREVYKQIDTVATGDSNDSDVTASVCWVVREN